MFRGSFSEEEKDKITNKITRVSRNTGKIRYSSFADNAKDLNLNNLCRNRTKRDLDNNSDQLKMRRKFIKKLIRRQPINSNITDVQRKAPELNKSVSLLPSTTQRKRRRKVKIKKRKRLLTPKQEIVNSNYLNGLEEHGQEATKPRKKLVITRKRVLPNNTSKTLTSESINPTTTIKHPLTTKMLMENSNFDIQIEKSEIAEHFRKNMDESMFGRNFNVNLSSTGNEFNNSKDYTVENAIDNKDALNRVKFEEEADEEEEEEVAEEEEEEDFDEEDDDHDIDIDKSEEDEEDSEDGDELEDEDELQNEDEEYVDDRDEEEANDEDNESNDQDEFEETHTERGKTTEFHEKVNTSINKDITGKEEVNGKIRVEESDLRQIEEHSADGRMFDNENTNEAVQEVLKADITSDRRGHPGLTNTNSNETGEDVLVDINLRNSDNTIPRLVEHGLLSQDEQESHQHEREDRTMQNIGNINVKDATNRDLQGNDPNENHITPSSQLLPEYEPFFPELSESTDVPVLLLKTTVVSNVELDTRTMTITSLRTYTFVITRVAGDEEIITTTQEIKPHIKTTTVTESSTLFTTLTLLDLDNMDKTDVQPTFLPTLEYNPSSLSVPNLEDNPDFRQEPRNLATRVMSNGVEVIVAGDKTTYPGDKDFKRVLPSIQKPVTLKPSTLTDHMLLVLPQETTSGEISSTPLDPNQFVVKTCLTTFTYLTTYLEKGTTTVSSHEQVVSNVATEERINTGKILPTPAVGITLTQYPTLSVGVFHTTYTYLNTILDGEQPLVISSQHVVANTVTAPDDYLSLLKPSEVKIPVRDTNTYLSTIDLEKTLYEDGSESVISTREVVTQVVITESIPPRERPVMTSYIALDMGEGTKKDESKMLPSTTDVTKTYFVTYTYFNTILENGVPTVYTNISTESDIVTEKVLLQPKKTISNLFNNTASFLPEDEKKKHSKNDTTEDNTPKFDIIATRTYFTTFTYFTTLLKENDPQQTTIINSRTKVVQNVITETLDPSLFDSQYLSSLSEVWKNGSGSTQKFATLADGQQIEITVQANDKHNEINPTKVLPIEKTQMPPNEVSTGHLQTSPSAKIEGSFSTSKPNVITGSTIVFIDDDPFADLIPTPSLSSVTKIDDNKISSQIKSTVSSVLASSVVKETKVDVVTSKIKRPGHKNKNKNKDKMNPTKATSSVTFTSSEHKNNQKADETDKNKKTNHPAKITSTKQPASSGTDLLGLGSININTLQALTPVLSAMAGYINKNLKPNRRNDVNSTTVQSEDSSSSHIFKQVPQNKKDNVVPVTDVQNRSPVYIPVGGAAGDDFEIAESQNIATFDWNEPPGQPQTLGKVKQEAPLLGNNGIPISPGDIITANSDVIVGKPGRVGPRLPSTIPIHRDTANEVPLGMKPPPLTEEKKNRGDKNKIIVQKPHMSVLLDQVTSQTNIIHAPNKDDYVGPPPPPRQIKDKLRGEKRKHIPLSPPHYREQHFKPGQFQIAQNQKEILEYHHNQYSEFESSDNKNILQQNANIPLVGNQPNSNMKYAPQYAGEQPPPYNGVPSAEKFSQNDGSGKQNLQETININYNLESQKQQSPPVYAAHQKPLILPSVPIVLPEVIERSTGQPLLVQLQPSQVAFVSIPFNRTTALIYGGSTETHHNGQYFDDPSPYPEPEFRPIEGFKDGMPQFASIYNDAPQRIQINQKQVSGVIKVKPHINHAIKSEPDASANEKVPMTINPTRPIDGVHFDYAEIGGNIHPLSFGMTEQDGDVNAHIINHDEEGPTIHVPGISPVEDNNNFHKRPVNFGHVNYKHQRLNNHDLVTKTDVTKNVGFSNYSKNSVGNQPTNQDVLSQEIRPPQKIPLYPEEQHSSIKKKPVIPFRSNSLNYPHTPKRNLLRPRPRPNRPKIEISEFMTPPPINKYFDSKRPHYRPGYVPEKDRVAIPLIPEPQLKPADNNFDRFEINQESVHMSSNVQPDSGKIMPIFDSPKIPHIDSQATLLSNVAQNNRQPASGMNVNKYHHINVHKEVTNTENDDIYVGDDHLEDNIPNEDGEVVQESNNRPLKPGEVPLEVLKKGHTSATERISDLVRFPDSFQNSTHVRFPYNHFSKPEIILPVAKPLGTEGNRFTEQNLLVGTSTPSHIFVNHESRPSSAVPYKPTTEGIKPQSQTEENTLDVSEKPTKYLITQFTTESSRFKTKTRGTTVADNLIQTQKPVLIFIDENGQQNTFFQKKPLRNNRPKVTSLPIDSQTSIINTPKTVSEEPAIQYNSQTEKPFDSSKYPKQPSNDVNIFASEQAAKTPTSEEDYTSPSIIHSILLNSGENFGMNFANLTQEINNMEVLQPPPLVEELPKMPIVTRKPPEIEINSPGHDIIRVPQIKTKPNGSQVKQVTTSMPLIPELSQEMLPPPVENIPEHPESVPTTEIVLGMSPPPLVSSHKPVVANNRPHMSEANNIFSMEIDVPKEPLSTTKRYDSTKSRPPPFRKQPNYSRSTTSRIPTVSAHKTTPYQGYFRTSPSTTKSHKANVPNISTSYKSTTEVPRRPEQQNKNIDNVIIPTPTLRDTPSLEVIVGQPQLNIKKAHNEEVIGESSKSHLTTESQNLTEPDQVFTSSTQATSELIITVPHDLTDIITKPVHHAGNEVKIEDEPTLEAKISTATYLSNSKENKSTIIPTRYITHTKTHTVTITKTTVVKTLGGPPSTLTLLVTKTEKSYIVDTITEFHTLIKPTSIVQTVTTTVQKENSLYPSDVYKSSYPIIPVKPTAVFSDSVTPSVILSKAEQPTVFNSIEDLDFNGEDDGNDSLEDFIITDADTIESEESPQENYDSNESIFVVMTDKNKGTIIKIPPQVPNKDNATTSIPDSDMDPPHRDEIRDSEVNNVLLGGILIANHPSVNSPEVTDNGDRDRCAPECKPSRNELCQKVERVMRCVCRPGFARMFPDRPCNPTYTYSMNITISTLGKTPVKYTEKLSMENSTEFMHMARKVHEALDRMVMQSDLRDVYHGVQVTNFYPAKNRTANNSGIVSKFYLQLSDNIDEIRMEDIFRKYLRNNNYSLGGTDVIASWDTVAELRAQDFDECENSKFHDCSENAQCFNLRGTYTCSCKEGYSDLSENMLYPGRICSAEQVGCEKCNYHGTCYSRGSEEIVCECFHWYAGEYCQLNLKVLLIALVTLGTILFALLLVCIILTCVRKKPNKSSLAGAIGFLPQRVGNTSTDRTGTLDRRAMIEDTSSEDSRSETNSVPPYVQQKPLRLKPPPAKGALKKVSRVSMTSVEHTEPGIIFPDQKDRSLTVMIPRAKYHPAPPTSPLLNYTTFDARKPSVPSVTPEAKLLSYLDAGPSPSKSEPKRKFSNAVSDEFIEEKPSSRKTSGALVSAGFEVSATVVNTMGTLGTTCGTEADRSENATLIQKISADLLSRADTSSQFNTLRKSLVDDDLESSSNWMDIPRISNVSESRSYDETTIPPPTKSFTRSEYDTKSLQHQNDEANTMAERDLGSTFLLPHTHLYKPDRGSDISGFESL